MKRYIPLMVLMATVLLLGTALKSENIVQHPVDRQLAVDGADYFNLYEAVSDYPYYPEAYGTVYFNGVPQDGAIVTLTDEDGDKWQDTTHTTEQGSGQYYFWGPFCGDCRIQACYGGECTRQYNVYIGCPPWEVHVNLGIGSSYVPEPLPVYE